MYIRGLQGFVNKIKIEDMTRIEGEDLMIWFDMEKVSLNGLYGKIGF